LAPNLLRTTPMSPLPAPRPTAPSISLAAALAALAFTPFVEGAVVLSNFSAFSQGTSTTIYAGANSSEAVQITTGAGANWSVSSISILSNLISGSASFQIWTNNPGTSGSQILGTSQTISNTPGYAFLPRTFTFSTPVNLNGSTTYWFVLNTAGSNLNSTEWASNPSASPSTSAFGWSQGSQFSTTDSFATWSASSANNFVSLEIDATSGSAGVPDGTATALLLLPGAALLGLRSRRRRTSPA
jgi:hypothetical protein